MKWTEELVEQELRRIMEAENIEYVPSMKMIKKYSACCNQLTRRFGGIEHFSERMGIPDMRTYMARRVPHPCEVCGKVFDGRRSERYCSLTCRRSSERVCPECGKVFIGARKYCSLECRKPIFQENGRTTGKKRLEKNKGKKVDKKPEKRKGPTVYDGIHPSRAFAKERELGLPYAEIQTMEYPVEAIDTSPYAGLKTYAERMAERP